MPVEVRPVASKRELKAFMRLPWRLYRNEPNWVPPLLLENLPLEIVAKASSHMSVPMTTFKLPPEGIDIEEVERELIKQSLEITDWNQSKAAKKLNLGIDAFRYRMKKFGFLK